MKTPTLEEVKEYFKDAKKMKSPIGGTKYKINTGKLGIYFSEGNYRQNRDSFDRSLLLWDKQKGYAKIISYKEKQIEKHDKLRELTSFQYWLGSNYNTLPTDSTEMTKRANLYNEIIDSDMKITKKFIKENADKTFKEVFPDAFKEELVIGKWYYSKAKCGTFENLFITDDGVSAYGITNGKWVIEYVNFFTKVNIRPATEQEVFESLKNEAVKRGFKEGTYINRPFCGDLNDCVIDKNDFPLDIDFYYNLKNDYLEHYGFVIYSKGQWAEIIPTITKEEAEKKLGRKIID